MKYPIDPSHEYCSHSSTPNSQLLDTIERNTFLHTVDPFNYSGHLQGRILSMFSKMISPKRILEVGTFTAYGTLCLAEGLQKDGDLITIEINQEIEFLIRQHIDASQWKDQITVQFGDASILMKALSPTFELIFLDGAKREYELYYGLALDLLDIGGYILIDNVLWKGKIIKGDMDPRTKAMRAFNQFIKEDDRVENVVLPMCDGFQVLRKI